MIRQFDIAVMLFLAIAVAATASQTPGQRDGRDHQQQEQKQGSRSGNQHRGEWLKKHQNLPPKEQEKALERDPEFRKLSPERQEQLRERLRRFSTMPPQQRERVIHRMETWDRLTPQQKLRARAVYGQVRNLPEDRRRAMYEAARNLSAMPPQQREQALNSPPMRTSFSDSERDMLRSMVDLGLTSEHQGQGR